jgi:hypothetical protein
VATGSQEADAEQQAIDVAQCGSVWRFAPQYIDLVAENQDLRFTPCAGPQQPNEHATKQSEQLKSIWTGFSEATTASIEPDEQSAIDPTQMRSTCRAPLQNIELMPQH